MGRAVGRWGGRWCVLLAVAFLGACASTAASTPAELPLADVVVEATTSTSVSPSSTTVGPSSTVATPTTSTIPPDPYRTWIATAVPEVSRLVAYDSPGGEPIDLPFGVPNPHQFGGPLALMVTEGGPGDEWVKVQLPIRPNGQEGWVPTSAFTLTATRIRAEVDLASTSVTVFDGPDVIAQTEAVVGAARTPTPLGRFFVAAVRENPPEESFLGPYALALSGFSEALETFGGGLPVIAIHGTSRPDQLGERISNGCIRVPNDVIEFLAEHVPPGAPVDIYA